MEREASIAAWRCSARSFLAALSYWCTVSTRSSGWKRDKYTAAASEAHQRNITVPARRGSIYDTNGYPLAVTVELTR